MGFILAHTNLLKYAWSGSDTNHNHLETSPEITPYSSYLIYLKLAVTTITTLTLSQLHFHAANLPVVLYWVQSW